MVKLTNFLDPEFLFPDLSALDTADCLQKIVNIFFHARALKDPSDALAKLLERERVMSTGIGGGVAIPHARCESIDRTIISIALLKVGIDFKSIDGIPVKVIFLILGPQDAAAIHLKLLAQIARMIKGKDFIDSLSHAKTSNEILALIKFQEIQEAEEDGVE